MTNNTYYETENMFNRNELVFHSLHGLNRRARAESKITFLGDVDELSRSTLLNNYDRIASNLNVYPTVTIYPRTYNLEGGMGGFYYAENNHIDLKETDYLIRILAHEMRHAFQYMYLPDLFFATKYKSARQYINCYIETDARQYALDFCVAREYWLEAEFLEEEEKELDLFLKRRLSAKSIGLSESYFRSRPAVATNVPQSYHMRNQGYSTQIQYKPPKKVVKRQWRIPKIDFQAIKQTFLSIMKWTAFILYVIVMVCILIIIYL